MKDRYLRLLEQAGMNRRIVLYGAGIIGKCMFNWLIRNQIDADKIEFAISDGAHPVYVFGKYSYYISELADQDALFFLTASEANQPEMIRILNELAIKDYIAVNAEMEAYLFQYDLNFYMQMRNESTLKFLQDGQERIRHEIKKNFAKNTKRTLLNFEIHVAEHCNLNCRGCDHFSPLAKPELLDIHIMERDFQRLRALSEGRIGHIKLLGGEPLLHTEIARICRITRKYFPQAFIEIVSNGILLNKMGNEFWQTCAEENIVISVTKYPIGLDFKLLAEKADDRGVKFRFFGGSDAVQKTLWHLPLDESGSQDANWNFYQCFRPNDCIILSNGKLYNCVVPANIHHFNDYFHKRIPVTDQDYVDIYEINSMDEIFEFLAKPFAFCRYCNVNGETNGHKWSPSKRTIEEWT